MSLFEVKNFKIGRQRKASHDGTTNDLTHRRRRSKQKETNGKGEKKRAKVFENCLRSGGEQNERRMANNVMRGRRVYDGYLV